MRNLILTSIILFFSILLISCGGSGGDESNNSGNGGGNEPGPVAPKAATLSKPDKDSECLQVDAVKFE